MSWVKLDDSFFTNPKVTAVQPVGRLLYMAGLCYCASALTDGEIHGRQLTVLHAQTGSTGKHVEQLVTAGLWVRHVDSFWVPDYLAYNPSREKVLAEREAARQRQARARGASAPGASQGKSQRESRPMSRRDIGRSNGVSHGPPHPTPSVSSSDYENNAGPVDVVPFAAKPPKGLRAKAKPQAAS